MSRLRFWTLLLLALGPGTALADKRVALVIGNSAYKHWGKLDTTGMMLAANLKGLGLNVVEGPLISTRQA